MTIPTPPESPMSEVTTPVAMQEVPHSAVRPAWGLVRVLAVLVLIGAAVETCSALSTLAMSTDSPTFRQHLAELILGSIIAVAALISGIGLLRRRRWARAAALWTILFRAVTAIPLELTSMLRQAREARIPPDMVILTGLLIVLATIAYYGLLIFLLLRPGIQAALTPDARTP